MFGNIRGSYRKGRARHNMRWLAENEVEAVFFVESFAFAEDKDSVEVRGSAFM